MKRLSLLVVILLALGAALAAPSATARPLIFTAQLSGDNEVPPRDTLGRGEATFFLNPDGTQLDYRIIVANIDNVVASHIHVAPAGVNGPIVAPLFSGAAAGRADGILAEGTITAANLRGPLAGHPLSDLIAAMEAGNTYTNVHTTQFPGGEIRGQIH